MKPGHGSPGRGNVAFTSPDGSPGLPRNEVKQIQQSEDISFPVAFCIARLAAPRSAPASPKSPPTDDTAFSTAEYAGASEGSAPQGHVPEPHGDTCSRNGQA